MTSGAVEQFDVVVVGAGIAGLATAHRLLDGQPHLRIAICETTTHAGGRLGSARIAGITVDTAADAFLARVPGAVELATELGLGDQLVAPSTGEASVVVGGVLRALPHGLVLGVPTDLDALGASNILSRDGLQQAATDLTVARALPRRDRSVAEAVGTHLGNEVVERLVDPLLGGISAANSRDLSVDAVSPQIAAAACQPHLMAALVDAQATQQRGQIGVTETRPVFLAPREGVHALVERLRDRLHVHLRTDTPALAVLPDGNQWVVRTPTATLRAPHVVVATPALTTTRLLADAAPIAAEALQPIRYASVTLVVLAYRDQSTVLPAGSGMLVPRREGRLVTAASWWDQKWPHLRVDGVRLIRASVGRIDDTRPNQFDDGALVDAIHDELASLHGLTLAERPLDAAVARWTDSFAQYDVGHLASIDVAEAGLPRGLHLAGASLRGVGLPACIRSANAAAAAIVAAG